MHTQPSAYFCHHRRTLRRHSTDPRRRFCTRCLFRRRHRSSACIRWCRCGSSQSWHLLGGTWTTNPSSTWPRALWLILKNQMCDFVELLSLEGKKMGNYRLTFHPSPIRRSIGGSEGWKRLSKTLNLPMKRNYSLRSLISNPGIWRVNDDVAAMTYVSVVWNIGRAKRRAIGNCMRGMKTKRMSKILKVGIKLEKIRIKLENLEFNWKTLRIG